jgi:hypothetical protein
MTPEQDAFLDKASLLLVFTSNVMGEASAILGGDAELDAISSVLISAHLHMAEKLSQLTTPVSAAANGPGELIKRRERLANRLRSPLAVFALNPGPRYSTPYSPAA